jgi:hypothetical protein
MTYIASIPVLFLGRIVFDDDHIWDDFPLLACRLSGWRLGTSFLDGLLWLNVCRQISCRLGQAIFSL